MILWKRRGCGLDRGSAGKEATPSEIQKATNRRLGGGGVWVSLFVKYVIQKMAGAASGRKQEQEALCAVQHKKIGLAGVVPKNKPWGRVWGACVSKMTRQTGGGGENKGSWGAFGPLKKQTSRKNNQSVMREEFYRVRQIQTADESASEDRDKAGCVATKV